MRRLLGSLALFTAFAALPLAGAADKVDSPKAAETRGKKLVVKVSVEYNMDRLRDVFDDLAKQVKAAGGGTLVFKTGVGVNLNTKITFSGSDLTLADALDKMFKAPELGYHVVSKEGDADDGVIRVTKSDERGYPKEEPGKGKTVAKKEPPKTTPKKETPATSGDEKAAASKLGLARGLIDDGKADKAKERLAEIIKQYPKTKAAEEAAALLKKLDN